MGNLNIMFILLLFFAILSTLGYCSDMYEHWRKREHTSKWIHIFGIFAMWFVIWLILNNS